MPWRWAALAAHCTCSTRDAALAWRRGCAGCRSPSRSRCGSSPSTASVSRTSSFIIRSAREMVSNGSCSPRRFSSAAYSKSQRWLMVKTSSAYQTWSGCQSPRMCSTSSAQSMDAPAAVREAEHGVGAPVALVGAAAGRDQVDAAHAVMRAARRRRSGAGRSPRGRARAGSRGPRSARARGCGRSGRSRRGRSCRPRRGGGAARARRAPEAARPSSAPPRRRR